MKFETEPEEVGYFCTACLLVVLLLCLKSCYSEIYSADQLEKINHPDHPAVHQSP